MRLAIHVHGWFHARTEPWRYEDFPAQHRAQSGVKVFGVWTPARGRRADHRWNWLDEIITEFPLPLRPLSRVAGDYFSDSVVCIGNSASSAGFAWDKDNSVLFFTQSAQRAQSFISPCVFTLTLEWSQTSLRQECAESFIHPLPPCGRCPHVAMEIATLSGHRMTSSHSS